MSDITDDPQEEQENQTIYMESGSPDAKKERRAIKIFCHKCQQKLDVTNLEAFSRFLCPMCGAELIVPDWFDNYILEEPIGVGGMATVYRALDLALDREVAIKILNQEVLPESELSELFLNEARTAATINHYAVVPIYTCGVCDGKTYIVMQFMNGGSLETRLRNSGGRLPVDEVARWIHDVAEGLENANKHGIVHHDIKPANIMLDSDSNVKIGDFGLAQAVREGNSKVQKLTDAWISPNYVSPERISSGKESFQGDIYSLGATFYHLVTGVTPFSNDKLEELIWMRLKHNPVAPNQIRPELAPELSALIMKMMSRAPDMRPSYREIVTSLEVYLRGKNSTMTGTRRFASSTRKSIPPIPAQRSRNFTATQTTVGSPGVSVPQKPVNRIQHFIYHPLVIVTVSAILLVTILAVAAYLLFSDGGIAL